MKNLFILPFKVNGNGEDLNSQTRTSSIGSCSPNQLNENDGELDQSSMSRKLTFLKV